MIKLGTVKFSGLSGNRYAFTAYPMETVFDAPLSGVYIVTRRSHGKAEGGFAHKRLRMGQSDKLRQLLTRAEQSLSAKGANCICVHAETDKDASLKIEQDLWSRPPAGIA